MSQTKFQSLIETVVSSRFTSEVSRPIGLLAEARKKRERRAAVLLAAETGRGADG